jgi:hypothetical protein
MISEAFYDDLAVICRFLGELHDPSSADMKLLQLKSAAQAALADCTSDTAERFLIAAEYVARLIMLEQGLGDDAAMKLSAKFSSALTSTSL